MKRATGLRILGLILLLVLGTWPAPGGSGVPGRRSGEVRPTGAVPSLKQAGRWAEKRAAGKLTPAIRRLLEREEAKAAALNRGKKPWQKLIRTAPRAAQSGGRSPAVTEALDSLAAAWVRHYSSGLAPSTDAITAITYDAAGNVYATGYTTGIFTGTDMLTIKYSAAGVQQWVATYSGPGNDFDAAVAIAVDGSGNVIVTGSSFGIDTEEDYATIKYGPSGQELWVARYNGPADDFDAPSGLAVDAIGQVVVTGVSTGIGTDGDYLTIKYTAGGVEQWVRRYNGPASDFDMPAGVGLDLSGSVYVGGTSIADDTWEDYAVVKYSFAGDESWVRRYDGSGNDYDVVASIAVDIAGNSYVTGSSTNINFDIDIVTVKYRTNGDREWLSVYSTPDESDELAAALCIDASRNVYVAGVSYGFGTGEDYLTIKYSSSGGTRWVAQYNGTASSFDTPSAIAVDGTGGVYVTGSSMGLGSFEDMVTLKYNSVGLLLWTQRYAPLTNDYDAGLALAVDASGRVHVGGSTYGTVTDEDAVVAVYTTGGSEQWVGLFNGPGNSADEAVAVALDAGGNVYVTGTSYDQVTQSDYATVKYSPAGAQLWVARYNGTGDGDDYAGALAVDAAGNVYVTGTSLGEASGYDIATVKYTTNGARAWTVRYTSAGSAIDQGNDIAVDGSGNVYVTGSRTAAGTGVDFITIKYTAAGQQSWAMAYNGPSDSTDEAFRIALDPAGNPYVTGASFRDGFGDDCVTVRYNTAGAQQWAMRYNGAGNLDDEGYDMAVDGSGVVVGGVTRSATTGIDMLLVRYNLAGAQQWVQTYNSGGVQEDVLTGVRTAGAGVFCVTGTSRTATTGYDFVTMKYTGTGTRLWTATTNSIENDDDVPTWLTVDAAGNVTVTGYSFLAQSGYDYLTVKYTGAGQLSWYSRYDNVGFFNDEPRSVAVDASGNTYVGGFSETEEGSVYSLVKYEAPLLQFSRASVVFPSLQAGCRIDDAFAVRNPSGTNPLVVSSIVSTDPSFTVMRPSFTVPPGESVSVAVRFAPLGPGTKSGLLIVHHNALSTPDTVSVSGTGTGSAGGILVSAPHPPGWRLFSLPVTVVCPMIIPFSYAFQGGYFRSDTIVNQRGYWTKQNDPFMHFTGFPITASNVPVVSGWNLIGGPSSAVDLSALATIPDSILQTSFFGYNGAYFFADTMYPGFGYWVKATQPGLVLLSGGAGTGNPAAAIPEEAGRIVVSDAAGNKQELRYLTGPEYLPLRLRYELPPVPPEGGFDARFGSDRMVEVAVPGAPRDIPVSITAEARPVRIAWSAAPGQADARLVIGGTEYRLAAAGDVTIDDLRAPVILRLGAGEAVPVSFGLEQNFPNPFNPSTDIGFSVPVRSHVLLRVFDVLGRPVRTLEDGPVAAGRRSVRWDGLTADGLPAAAGVYFYRIEAAGAGTAGTTMMETRKMMLLK